MSEQEPARGEAQGCANIALIKYMRVQPHLPSSPLTAMVIDSDGLAACACSAANRPAPPDPRMRMSVRRRRMLLP